MNPLRPPSLPGADVPTVSMAATLPNAVARYLVRDDAGPNAPPPQAAAAQPFTLPASGLPTDSTSVLAVLRQTPLGADASRPAASVAQLARGRAKWVTATLLGIVGVGLLLAMAWLREPMPAVVALAEGAAAPAPSVAATEPQAALAARPEQVEAAPAAAVARLESASGGAAAEGATTGAAVAPLPARTEPLVPPVPAQTGAAGSKPKAALAVAPGTAVPMAKARQSPDADARPIRPPAVAARAVTGPSSASPAAPFTAVSSDAARDPDVELVAALMARANPSATVHAGDGPVGGGTATPATIASLVKSCSNKPKAEAERCRREICSGYWGKAEACPAIAAGK